MNFTFEQLSNVVTSLSNQIPISIVNENELEIVRLSRGNTTIDFLRGENEKLDLIMVIKCDSGIKLNPAVVCCIDNASTTTVLSVGMTVAELFVNTPGNRDIARIQSMILDDIQAIFTAMAKEQYH